MELFLELLLTVSLSLIFTSLIIKFMSSMQPFTDIDRLTKKALNNHKFQRMPLKEEVIKLEECASEGKSSVKFYNVVGVIKEDQFQDVVVVDSMKGGTKDDDHDDDNGHGDGDDIFGENDDNDADGHGDDDDDDGHGDGDDIFGANDDHDDDGHGDDGNKDTSHVSEKGNGGERKFNDIEIESVEEKEEEEEKEGVDDGIMDDWEEIGRKDFEELLGNKAGLY